MIDLLPMLLVAVLLAVTLATIVRLRKAMDALRSAEAKQRRMGDIYAALSRTNRLIVREHDAQKLLAELCNICVETGQARMAALLVMQGHLAVPAATAGTRPSTGMEESLDTVAPESQAFATVRAIREGVHIISQDYQNDPGAVSFREWAIEQGVRALGVFPIQRDGRVFGTLKIYAGELNYFDAPLLRLMDELVADVAFALDGIDRELARVAAVRETQASQDQFRKIFKSAPIATTITSMDDLRIVEINDVMSAQLGLPEQVLIGRRLQEDLHAGLLEEDVPRFQDAMRTQGFVRNLEVGVRLPDGSQAATLMSSEAIDYLGRKCMLTMSVDVTEIRKVERAREAQIAAESANRAKTEFLSSMSHELRTPLNAVIGFSSLLQSEAQGLLTPQHLARLDHIRRAGIHLLGLVDDVLDVSGIEAGRIDVKVKPTELHALLDDAFEISQTLARKMGIQLTAAYRDCAALCVLADSRRLRQVVINLMSNAIKYNRAGGSVTLDASGADGRVAIEIVDTGMGMTVEQLDHLYEPFNRLGRERGGIEGTGIGLALTQQLVRLMKGQLTIQSEAGRGTRARVSLLAAELPGEIGPAAERACLPAPDPTRSRTILYIEDNEVNALLVEQMLSHLPQVIFVHAADGKSGVERATLMRPDIVLLDMQLPDMTGIDVVRLLRTGHETRAARVVALSASAMLDDVEQARLHGCNAYWTKPLDFRTFLADVSAELAQLDASERVLSASGH